LAKARGLPFVASVILPFTVMFWAFEKPINTKLSIKIDKMLL
jgi:hypothetical protein